MEPAQSPKPAVSCEDFFPRVEIYSGVTRARLSRSRSQRSGAKLGRFAWGNPLLLGHGLRRCLKNLPASKVSSVSYEQIRVAKTNP